MTTTTITKRSFTSRQFEVMELIRRGDPETGGFIDMDQLLEALPFDTTKQSFQFSIRALIRHGVVVKASKENRRGRSRVCYALTPLAYLYLESDPDVVTIELLKDDEK